jgi:hypothetical protein
VLSIAVSAGFADAGPLLDHPENADLPEAQTLLEEGTRVFVPEPQTRTYTFATAEVHTVRVQRPKAELRLRIQMHLNQPLRGWNYTLSIGGEDREGTLDDDGCLREPISMRVHEGHLCLEKEEDGTLRTVKFSVHIGALAPNVRVRGVQARLHNLGLDPGRIDGVLGPRSRAALRLLQTSRERELIEHDADLEDAMGQELGEDYGC